MLMAGNTCMSGCTRCSTGDRGDYDENGFFLTNFIETGVYYVGKINDEERVVVFEDISKKSFNAVIYSVISGDLMQKEEVSGKFKRKKCVIRHSGNKIVLNDFSLSSDRDGFSGRYSEGVFSFRKYSPPPFQSVDKINRYASECFEVETIRDVKYGRAKGYWVSRPESSSNYAKIIASGILNTLTKNNYDLYMDIYLPKGDQLKERPLVLFIHGGGFFIGDKRDNAIVLWCQHFAKMGYVVASINYRMGFRPTKSSIERCGYRAVQDAHAAMRFLVHNKEKYGINPEYLFVAGSSAGGVTTLNLAFMRNFNRPESVDGGLLSESLGRIETSGNSLTETFNIRCIANMWGAVHDISMINNNRVSIISFHGDADQVVPYGTDVPFKDLKLPVNGLFFNKMYGSKPIHDRARQLGYREELHTFKGCGHAPHVDDNDRPTDKFYYIQEKMTNFFYKEFGSEDVRIKPLSNHQFILSNVGVESCSWRITGGIILSKGTVSVRAVWFPEAGERKLECTGRLKNGAGFSVQYIPHVQ